jgi:sterol 24-C-methyltransferase
MASVGNLDRNKVEETATSYTDMFTKKSAEDRKANYTTLVNQYYDLATDFYEYGWGTSFHFAPRYKTEALAASIARHEHFLATKLKLKPGDKVLDVGCGVGGPLIEIARFSG